MKKYRSGPLFTPPSLRGTLQLPGNEGGANWGGAIWDAQAGRLYVRSRDVINYTTVVASDGTDKFIDHPFSGHLPVARPGTRLGAIPLIKPPYAHLTAIDLNKGEIAWKVPVGEGSSAVRSHPLLKDVRVPDRLGSPANGGAILTGGGLIFIGGGDGYLYAFDRNDGRELWRGQLPYVNGENTMTYRLRTGRQFVLISTGAGVDASLVAFALPDGPGATASRPVADSGQREARPAPQPGAEIQGKLAFDRVCQTCHGSGARGGAGPGLAPFSREYDELLGIVREGAGEMPPISARELSDEGVAQVLAYLKSLSR
jgi:mono/diheme cytochrome c family protein